MKKVVLAIDSFKGSLSSLEAEEAAAQGIRRVFPACETVCLPIADGGEGMQEVLVSATGGSYIHTRAHNPLMEVIDTRYGMAGDGKTAFIEMAAVSGFPLLPPEKRNPLLTTSYGTGELIREALDKGCTRFVIGLGGSATNDAGMGMLQALGFRFFNAEGKELGTEEAVCGRTLAEIDRIDTSMAHRALRAAHFTAACDVRNPFFGPEGAAYVFAPQKGATPDMVKLLDQGLKQVAAVLRRCAGKDISDVPGSGAAGGMGGGLLALLNAELRPGIDMLADFLHLEEHLEGADLVITDEGKADRQTLMGKVPYGILARAQKRQVPVILLAGSVEDTEMLNEAGFLAVCSITPCPLSLQQAMLPENARMNMRQMTEQLLRLLRAGNILRRL